MAPPVTRFEVGMKKLRWWLDKTIEVFACTLSVIMVCVACWQVISRYLFNSPSTFSEELLRFSLVWISVIGLAYVAGKREHISLTLFLDKCPAKLTTYWNIVIQAVFIFFSIYILIIGGMKVSNNAMMQISPVLKLSMGKVYYALPLSGILTIIYCLLNIVDLLKERAEATQHDEQPQLAGDKHHG
ncbi:TRAP-type C4-dicarboxylate transport system, small permease component [Vibrio xiamenensis]|uniref:TRAP transporter small permease protein n=2 Tax=Vibrio xiamenensis TaxID=861298 RepID=A0A1G7ZMT3_9VIBR|nr:TRAP-type C4-dicarboxylate transport system, small permease component [Vibrio xiamenensis]